ncbi:MAG: methyltetrahydrofolate cobalamin methyltransferase [Chloroflexi bacterium]|jgi:5-methyltetrahydrofolate--homocysteine methyltransferase|nr:methyltetrahydrofolate cobalamin methyltransferase [Chloroflexota bacterium]
MIIVGEKINTSRKSIEEAVKKRDAAFITKVARDQAEAGAHYIDVNAGTFLDQEVDCLCWLVKAVQKELDLPLCLDSPNPTALSEAIKHHKGEPMINSISLEEDRFKALLPVITSQPCHVVALCMAQTSMPTTVEERVQVGSELINRLTDEGIPLENIYVDPLVQPVSVGTGMGVATLGAINKIMHDFPGVNTICGLSNISFGLPERRLINRNFLALCISYGLSAAILDPTDKQLMATLLAVEMLLGRDEYCENFIDAYQKGRIARG